MPIMAVLLWWAMANPQPVCTQIWEDGFRETVDCKHPAKWADHKMPQNAEQWPPACGPDNCIAPIRPSARLRLDHAGPFIAIFSPKANTDEKPPLPPKGDITCWRGKDDKIRCEDSAGHDATAPLKGGQ